MNLFKLGLLTAVACFCVFVLSGFFMAKRVEAYYEAVPPPQHLFKRFYIREFPAFGRTVTLTDATTPDGKSALRIRSGDQETLLPVHPPKARDFKDLSSYDEWLAVLAFAPMAEGRVDVDPATGRTDVRLAVVKRNAAPGQEDDPIGLVGRKLWTFDVVEILADGGFAQRRMQFRDRQGNVPALEADPASVVVPIEERTWEFQAALFAIPKLHISRYRYTTDAVQGSAGHDGIGWTLPAAAFSMLGVVVGCGLMMAGRATATPGPRQPAPALR